MLKELDNDVMEMIFQESKAPFTQEEVLEILLTTQTSGNEDVLLISIFKLSNGSFGVIRIEGYNGSYAAIMGKAESWVTQSINDIIKYCPLSKEERRRLGIAVL